MKQMKHSQMLFYPEIIDGAALPAKLEKIEMKHAFGCLHYI